MSSSRQILLITTLLLVVITTVTAVNVQITREQFEQLFNINQELAKAFHSKPGLANLFARDTAGHWQPLFPDCIAELLTETEAQVHNRCFERTLEFYKDKPKLADIRLVYRCFKSDNPYDYDLHQAPIDRIEENLMPSMQISSLHFTPQKSTNGCRIRPFDEMDSDVLLEQVKETKKEDFASATAEDVTPLNKETFEAAMLNRNSFEKAKWLTYIFQRNQDTLSTELEPIRECVIKLSSEGTALAQQFCGQMLSLYRILDDKLPHIVLPIRCYHHHDPTEYDLQVVPIEDVFKDADGRLYVITFTRPKSDTCTPVWANDAEVPKTKHDLKAEHQQYLASLTKDRFEEALTGLEQMPKLLPYFGFIFHPDPNTNEKILAPITNCQAMLVSSGKALINHSCARVLKILASVSNLSSYQNLLLTYRCYLVDDPNEYELHVVNLEKLGEQPSQGLHYVHFKTKQSDQCRAMWMEAMPEDDADGDYFQRMVHTEL